MSAFRGAEIVSSYDTNLGLIPRVDRANSKNVGLLFQEHLIKKDFIYNKKLNI